MDHGEAARFERMTIALEAARIGVWDWNIGSGETIFDDQYYRISGYEPGTFEPCYREWRARLHPDDEPGVIARLESHLAGEAPDFNVTFRFRRADDSWGWLAATGRIMARDADGKPLRMVGIHADIAEQKRIEEELRQSRRMDAIGQLAGGVAHDFNNMLGGILGYADLLAERMEPGSEDHEFAVGIARAAERAGDLTAKLLAFSRKGAHDNSVFDLHQEIESVRALLSHTLDPRIVLAVEAGARSARVRGDAAQVQSALLNLAVNARDALPDGGRLTIRTCDVPAAGAAPPRVRIEVADTGIGIPPELLDRIFEPYFTTKEAGKGTGLGLAAVYGTVLEHGGAIDVASEPGRGTTFRVELPVVDEEAAPRSETAADATGPLTVLVVDDEEVVRRMLRAVLEADGHTVLEASDGRRGVEVFSGRRDEIDLVLLDVAMPGMNGAECFAELRALVPEVRVVVVTGYAEDHGGFPGRAGLLRKPFRNRDLQAVLRRALAASPRA